ncbi:ABC transporter ATP-binding protein [Ruicaihuangia caeni]|uniref:ABC-type quaternary amine transporter n=1 Tax=Ruicaihuangia caeni TaxID=3042517 RepID=A0AAW6TBA4_9MICO|nr:ABC transporter ATP-binding protein [Klugiella sp. YN-L-19]MDI2098357.1 ABC transporter ATP-binding protein [Klugiella sp. YN-L-19]
MSWVNIADLSVAFGELPVLSRVGLAIPRGDIVAVLGPSGCGKTTLLRAIAGLVPIADGEVRVGDRLLSGGKVRVAPERRGIGWVPQDAALFPHLTVAENIAFGLRGPAWRSPEARAARVTELAGLVGLADHVKRTPAQLSGGQAQRVALARALAPRPDLVLLDEPFSALDPMLRVPLRREVADVLRDQRSTALLVTHDQQEALSLADHVAVMMGGRVLQWGTPAEVYRRPATPWVARFVGDTVELDGVWSADAGGRSVDTVLGRVPAELVGEAPASGSRVRVVFRPEWLRIEPEGVGVAATVTELSFVGHEGLVTLELTGGAIVRSRALALELPRPGQVVSVTVRHPALVYAHAGLGAAAPMPQPSQP